MKRSQLQLLPHLHVPPIPEGLLLLLQHPLWHQHLLQRGHLQDPVTALPKAVTGLVLSVLSLVSDVDLFQEEATEEGEVLGEVGPL